MADINVYFFWPSLIISIVLSILLTVVLNLWARRQTGADRFNQHDFSHHSNHCNRRDHFDSFAADKSEAKEMSSDSDSDKRENWSDDEPQISGMITIGPIPIIFGNGGFRFDKSAFKYALAFFLIIIFTWFILFRMGRF